MLETLQICGRSHVLEYPDSFPQGSGTLAQCRGTCISFSPIPSHHRAAGAARSVEKEENSLRIFPRHMFRKKSAFLVCLGLHPWRALPPPCRAASPPQHACPSSPHHPSRWMSQPAHLFSRSLRAKSHSEASACKGLASFPS